MLEEAGLSRRLRHEQVQVLLNGDSSLCPLFTVLPRRRADGYGKTVAKGFSGDCKTLSVATLCINKIKNM